MRAVIYLLDNGCVNVAADELEHKDTWIIVSNNGKIIGMFDEGHVKCAYLTKEKVKQ